MSRRVMELLEKLEKAASVPERLRESRAIAALTCDISSDQCEGSAGRSASRDKNPISEPNSPIT